MSSHRPSTSRIAATPYVATRRQGSAGESRKSGNSYRATRAAPQLLLYCVHGGANHEPWEAGADAYLLKGMPAEQILATIEATVVTPVVHLGPDSGPPVVELPA